MTPECVALGSGPHPARDPSSFHFVLPQLFAMALLSSGRQQANPSQIRLALDNSAVCRIDKLPDSVVYLSRRANLHNSFTT